MSLNNAFLHSGAKTVVSSLWKVDDEATRELMKNFYREMAKGDVPTAEALRRAQIKLRENPQYQSPFYRAALTAQGDYQICAENLRRQSFEALRFADNSFRARRNLRFSEAFIQPQNCRQKLIRRQFVWRL